MKKTTVEYMKAIRAMLKIKDLDTVNIANHRALETGLIDYEAFREAADYLVDCYLKGV